MYHIPHFQKILYSSFFILHFISASANKPESVYIRHAYRAGTSPVQLDYSIDQKHWTHVPYTIFSSDYGPWGSEKKLYNVVLRYDGKKYYAESDGQLHPGAYITIDGTEYHMDMSGAVIDGTPTIDQYLGCTDLLGWMLDHQSDYYYQTNFNPMTDYPDDPEMLIRPYGEYGDESHMNCAGFIAHMLKSAGGDLSKISDMGGRGGYTNADNYMKLCTSGLIKYETYDSIEDLLASGHAQKGDILYLQPNWNPGEDCHIGLFWGDTSSEDKFWQQNWDIKNAVTNIRMDDPIVKIYLIPISR